MPHAVPEKQYSCTQGLVSVTPRIQTCNILELLTDPTDRIHLNRSRLRDADDGCHTHPGQAGE